MDRTITTLAVVIASVGWLVAGCSSSAGPAAPDDTPSSTTITTPTTARPAAAAVDRLVVAEPSADLPPYRRKAFLDGWDYEPSTGCDTRELVLIEESLEPPRFDGSRCHPTWGRWRSRYDAVVTEDPDDLQIDHLVPLANAWESGASTWSPERRHAFAVGEGDADELVAVTDRTNLSKGDRSPDRWMPPDPEAACPYAADWVAVKQRWGLSVTAAEKSTLVAILNGC